MLIKHTSRGRRTVAECGICFERAHYESNLAESDKESAEVTGGVTADGILQALPILWKKGVAFFLGKLIRLHTFAFCSDECCQMNVKINKWFSVLTSFVDCGDFLNFCVRA